MSVCQNKVGCVGVGQIGSESKVEARIDDSGHLNCWRLAASFWRDPEDACEGYIDRSKVFTLALDADTHRFDITKKLWLALDRHVGTFPDACINGFGVTVAIARYATVGGTTLRSEDIRRPLNLNLNLNLN